MLRLVAPQDLKWLAIIQAIRRIILIGVLLVCTFYKVKNQLRTTTKRKRFLQTAGSVRIPSTWEILFLLIHPVQFTNVMKKLARFPATNSAIVMLVKMFCRILAIFEQTGKKRQS